MQAIAKPEDVGLSSGRLAEIGRWMGDYVKSGKLPGALTLVARRDRIAFLECQGHMDRAADKPLRDDTIFRLYSMTKPVTSVAAMMLYERGRFQLDDPVARYIPAFAELRVHVSGEGEAMESEAAQGPITIRQLLTHTAGLTYGFMDEGPVGALYRAEKLAFNSGSGDLGETVARLARMPLVCHPGTAWNYSVATDVLGHLVEVVSGVPLDRFMQDRILGPLGMTDTGFRVKPKDLERFAALYKRTDDDGLELVEAPGDSRFAEPVTLFSGGGGLVGTVADYFRFAEMLRRGGEFEGARLLGRKTVAFMTMNHLGGDLASMGQPSFAETSFEGIGFGLGVAVMLDPAKAQVIGTPGEYTWGGAASTTFWVDPVEELTVIFMTQLLPSDSYPLRRALRALAYQALID